MRLQHRPSAAPRCSRGRSWGPYLGDRRAHSPGEFTAASFASAPRGGGPVGPNQPAAAARTSSTTITAPTLVPQGPVHRVHRPPLRSLRPPRLRPHDRLRLRRVHSDAPRGGQREGARRLVGVEPPAASATARSRSRDAGGRAGTAAHSLRSPGYGRDPLPGMIRNWGTDRGRLVGAQSPWMLPWLDGSATGLICGIHESVPPHEPPMATWPSHDGGCDAAAEAAPLRPHLRRGTTGLALSRLVAAVGDRAAPRCVRDGRRSPGGRHAHRHRCQGLCPSSCSA
jgi:hypothetical protein